MSNNIIYEYPLNEKIRIFLRIEHIWQKIEYALSHEDDDNCLYGMQNILHLLEINDRFDLKSECIKYLDRLLVKFYKIHKDPDVDLEKLQYIIDELNSNINKLNNIRGKIAVELSKNEWLAVVHQKMLQPGGLTLIDLPFLKYWQQFPLQAKIIQLTKWHDHFLVIIKAIKSVLYYIRRSTNETDLIINNGSYQNIIESNKDPQMILLKIPKQYNIYPEISGNKYRYVVRLLQTDLESKACLYTDPVNLKLMVC